MSRNRHWHFSAESVSAGHPDKACDQVSDLIVDFFLDRDPQSSVSAQTMISDRFLAICGEFRADPVVVDEAKYVLPYRIRDLLAHLYPDAGSGFDWAGARKTFELKKQGVDVVRGGGAGTGLGAGDQGVVFGYACDETDELMPLPLMLAQKMMERHFRLFEARGHRLGSDAKCQVTVRYDGLVPKSVDKVVFSSQHAEGMDAAKLRDLIIEEVVNHVVPPHLRSAQIVYWVNPAGSLVMGGPQAGAGMTGRRVVVDCYGGSAPHGGGAFSGKDPGKMDRTGAYMARSLAKGVVLAGLASRCVVQLAYAAGKADPVSVMVDFQGSGTGSATEAAVEKAIASSVDLTPLGIISLLDLRRPIYQATAAFGHFGREIPGFAWETTGARHVQQALEKALG